MESAAKTAFSTYTYTKLPGEAMKTPRSNPTARNQLKESVERHYLSLRPGERRVLRRRFVDDPKVLARFDELDEIENGDIKD